MTGGTVPAPLTFSALFGALMVLAAAGTVRGPALIAAGVALAAVLAGVVYRAAAALAVLTTAAILAWSGPPVLVAAVSGLSAAAYLVSRYAAGAGPDSAVATLTGPTVLGMTGFTAVALAVAVLPWRLAWVPLLAPLIVIGIVVLAGAGLFREEHVRYE